ncbi:hypothetical protein Leryth_014593 [Lithospermum erythrorhizon]|nr:hypothetical protein Leryth_014593 [Lithospermum erythrorhizon]
MESQKAAVLFLHTAQVALKGDLENETEEDAVMNEFLSRFVWIMRGKLAEVYTDCDKKTVNAMLLIIVEKKWKRIGLQEMSGSAVAFSSENFSEDLWRTVREWHDFREGIWKLLSATFEGIFNATIFGVVVLQVLGVVDNWRTAKPVASITQLSETSSRKARQV